MTNRNKFRDRGECGKRSKGRGKAEEEVREKHVGSVWFERNKTIMMFKYIVLGSTKVTTTNKK